MALVELNLQSIPFGQPLPFALRNAGGLLLARKGYVIRNDEDLRVLLLRGQTLFVDTEESSSSYQSFRANLQEMLLRNKPLGKIANTTMAHGNLERATPGEVEQPVLHWGLWQERLTQLLREPRPEDFLPRFHALFEPLYQRCQQAPDSALLALIQLSADEVRHYSVTHSMLVAVVCMLTARQTLEWPQERIVSLGCAALSMNIGMAQLQDELARQTAPLTRTQEDSINQHARFSAEMLYQLGVEDALWLAAVEAHHQRVPGPLAQRDIISQMARLIQRADVFGARIAPRATREPMPVTAAMQASYYDETRAVDEIGTAIVKTLGIYPPGTWVRLASGEIGIVVRRGASAATPRVVVLINSAGIATGEPISRDTSQNAWKIISPILHKEVKVRLPLEKLLSL